MAKPVPEKANLFPDLSQLTDRFGNTFHFGNAGSHWHPAFPIGTTDYRAHCQKIRDMEIRPDDFLVCSFPKCGTHWHLGIVKMLVTGKLEVLSDKQIFDGFVDEFPMEQVDKLPSPRVLNTHVRFEHIPKQVFDKKIKIVCVERNPKDMLVSYYAFLHTIKPPLGYPGTWEQFFRLYMECGYFYGDMFDYAMSWQEGREAHPEMEFYISVFEDMKKDLLGGVMKLNAFLGTGRSEEYCEKMVELCTFKKFKSLKDTQRTEENNYFKEGSIGVYRKGQVGDWKNWFTVAMNEEFDAEYKKRMTKYKRQFIYT